MSRLHGIMNDLIEATKQERRRIEEPKNRSRYFIFGKVDGEYDREGYSVTFENVPDRVFRDARWSTGRGTEFLFRVNHIFVPGTMAIAPQGINVSFSMDEINRLLSDMVDDIGQTTDFGIEYVMDSRELTEQLLTFLESKAHLKNPFLVPLLQETNAISEKSVGNPVACPDIKDLEGLDQSKIDAIKKALSQKVTFFWGPPGTGKTKTMGALAAILIKNEKRVLLTSLANMALDQLLLTTLERFSHITSRTSIARLGSNMDEKCRGFSRSAFKSSDFDSRRAGIEWSEHVKHASLVAGTFAMLTFPRAADPGQFDYVMVDEASMANIPSLVTASFFAKTGIVVGGDPFQLPPIYPEDAKEPNDWFRLNIFEKAGVNQRDDPRAAFLDTQYRMQGEIGDLVSEMFYRDVDGLKTGTKPLPPIEGFGGRVVFIHSPGAVETIGADYLATDEHRRFNKIHAESAVEAVRTALRAGIKPSDIGIIAPYNAQVVQILHELREVSKESTLDIDSLKVSTIHSFQGQERRMIVVDFTDDNVRPTRLTAKGELINVALSRAKELLVIIGNWKYLLNESYFERKEIEIFKRLLDRAICWNAEILE